MQANIIDRWQWDPDIHDGYTMRGAYQILTDLASSTIDTTRDLVWHKQVPLKVSIVAWRLLKDRLPTRSNLHRRGIIPVEGDTCVWLRSRGVSVPFVHSLWCIRVVMTAYQVVDWCVWRGAPQLNWSFLPIYTLYRFIKVPQLISPTALAPVCVADMGRT